MMSDHHYEWYAAGRCHICKKCGTAKHKLCWWLAGKKYDTEPLCMSAPAPAATKKGEGHE